MSHHTFTIAIKDIIYDDEKRQRKELLGIEELAGSIKRNGLLNAIILDDENRLIAGRRRLEATRSLGDSTITARRLADLSETDKRLVELDENLRRVDLTWQEAALAIFELHRVKGEVEDSWDQDRTANYVGLSQSVISRSLMAAKYLLEGNEKVLACTNLEQAVEHIRRRRKLVLDTVLSRGFDDDDFGLDEQGESLGVSSVDRERGGHAAGSEGHHSSPGDTPRPTLLVPAKAPPYRIQTADFLTWLDTQDKPRFNFIHCDFPYGINFDKSAQAGSAHHETQYADTEDLFWKLTDNLLASQDRLILSSAHMIFWFSMKYYEKLRLTLERSGWFVVPSPLIWYKSDGAGIASDYRRRPKHVYETALFCSRGDRQISQLRNDTFAAPIAKNQEGHLSAKPLEMLKYFCSMACGPESYVLDPTCGSGTSIRAAAALGAADALGLEVNEETAEAARQRLSTFLLKEPECPA